MSAPTFKKSKVQQKINLKDEFGVDFRGMNSLKEAIGGAIIEHMRKRTKSSQGMSFRGGRGTPFNLAGVPYSKKYKKSLDYKAFGKTGTVNLTLTGDMLGLMDVTKIEGNTITVGWTDSDENAKAYNHSDPKRGKDKTVPYRPFFGISKTELKEIKKQFGSEIRNAIKTRNQEGREAFERRVAGLLDLVSGEESPIGTDDGES